jgi:hypothetical protein
MTSILKLANARKAMSVEKDVRLAHVYSTLLCPRLKKLGVFCYSVTVQMIVHVL